jgi:hypothetical protein
LPNPLISSGAEKSFKEELFPKYAIPSFGIRVLVSNPSEFIFRTVSSKLPPPSFI